MTLSPVALVALYVGFALGWIAFFSAMTVLLTRGLAPWQIAIIRRRILTAACVALVIAAVLVKLSADDGDVLVPIYPSEAQCAAWGTDNWRWWAHFCWAYYV